MISCLGSRQVMRNRLPFRITKYRLIAFGYGIDFCRIIYCFRSLHIDDRVDIGIEKCIL